MNVVRIRRLFRWARTVTTRLRQFAWRLTHRAYLRTDCTDAMTADEVLEAMGPSSSQMSERQRELYGLSGGLSDAEKDVLWGQTGENQKRKGDVDDAA